MIKEKIKEYRKRNNISQVELSKKLEISKGMLSNIETGKREVSTAVLHKLVEVTNTSWDFWNNSSAVSSNELIETNTLLELLINQGLIVNEIDIRNKVFENAIYTALETDLKHKIEEKKFLNKLDKNTSQED